MAVRTERYINVEGLNTRYLEDGAGPAVLLLHGSALGSSADVWEQHVGPLAARGLRILAYDRPGFGRTDDPKDASAAYQQQFVLEFMDALGIERAGIVGHSQTGNFAVNLALSRPERVSGIMVLGTGSLLPPLEGEQAATGPAPNENVFGREPTREDVRRVLETQLYNHALISPELIEARYQMSLGHVRAQPAPRPAGGPAVAMWERLADVKVPMLLLYGKDDRPTTAAQADLLRERAPNLDLRVIDRCKHLIQLDAADTFQSAAAAFFSALPAQ
jgi:2-hydroxy-6-oxonona-2,4-dienedioate hydrolase